ncbi:hypothetical protein [Pelagicoccus sp. SDUM812002]|uniref:hypothetical protein n=1 Tax=Pelagicoccus sp. SDUM812002 TaxID=3041266 RepID=UPI0028102B18|nr:hypothetical protein [Pelagicoccus sp. SDUM812002]MDQ8186628.1 hypothetical protein [Pelagicoccus sp. SDUM812002]
MKAFLSLTALGVDRVRKGKSSPPAPKFPNVIARFAVFASLAADIHFPSVRAANAAPGGLQRLELLDGTHPSSQVPSESMLMPSDRAIEETPEYAADLV